MTPAEFKHCLGHFADYYGDKALSPHMSAILWRIMQGLSQAEFIRVIDLVAEEHARSPSIASIKKAAMPFLRDAEARRQRLEVEGLEAAKESCKLCGFTGYVIALARKNSLHEYSFRCPACPAARARRLDERIPQWSDELRADFVPTSLREESFVAAKRLQREWATQQIEKRRGKALAPVNQELGEFAQRLAAQIVKRGVPDDAC